MSRTIGSIIAVGLAILIFAASCSEPAAVPSEKTVSTNTAAKNSAPSPCQSRAFEGSRFTVCPADPKTTQTRMVLTGASGKPLRSLAGLQSASDALKRTPLFGMNAGMYDDQGEPIGLYVSGGKARKKLNLASGSGNFHLLPNGVFWVDAQGYHHIDTAQNYTDSQAKNKPLEASQSGPMLVIEGKLHPAFDDDGQSRYIRNGVGIDGQGTAWFAISEEPVSFGKFARLFRDELHCPNALCFDGTVASIWIPAESRIDFGPPIGPMVLVEGR